MPKPIDLEDEVVRLYQTEKFGRVAGIKLVRQVTGFKLKQAKEIADQYLRDAGILLTGGKPHV